MLNTVWQNPFYFKLWSYCLMKASHAHYDQMVGNQIVKLNPGEFVTGRNSLAEDLNRGMKPKDKQSELTWWRHLKTLEKLEMLNIKSTTKYSIISILKWSEYQNDVQETEQQMNNKCTSNEQQMNTNKNVKNEKNEKNITTTTNPVIFYEQNIGLLSQFQMEELWNWNDDFNGQSEILIHAMKIAMDRNKKNMGFVKYLLKDWMDKGAKSLEDVQAIEIEQKGRRGVKHGKPQEDYIDKLF